MTLFVWIWKHRLEVMTVAQFMAANLAAADLVHGNALKWLLYISACLSGGIVAYNKFQQLRDARATEIPK